MEREITAKVGMNERDALLSLSRIECFHAAVEAKQEVVEIEPEPYAVGRSYLLIEFIEFKFAAGLVFVVADGPNVSGIDESGKFENPK